MTRQSIKTQNKTSITHETVANTRQRGTTSWQELTYCLPLMHTANTITHRKLIYLWFALVLRQR